MVEKQLIGPLAKKEAKRSRFSRAYQPPVARRVRVTDEKALTDSKGAEFMGFAVDVKHGALDDLLADEDGEARPEETWSKNAIVGCVYPDSGEVFIKRGGKYVGASLLLGKKSSAPEHVCQGTGAQVAAK